MIRLPDVAEAIRTRSNIVVGLAGIGAESVLPAS